MIIMATAERPEQGPFPAVATFCSGLRRQDPTMGLKEATVPFTGLDIGDGSAATLSEPAARLPAHPNKTPIDREATVNRSDAAISQTRAEPRSGGTRAAILTGPILATLLRLALPTMV